MGAGRPDGQIPALAWRCDVRSRPSWHARRPRWQRRELTPAAQRALAEAEERRRLADAERAANPAAKEIGGRDGPEPTRYGDWEKGGIASDF